MLTSADAEDGPAPRSWLAYSFTLCSYWVLPISKRDRPQALLPGAESGRAWPQAASNSSPSTERVPRILSPFQV